MIVLNSLFIKSLWLSYLKDTIEEKDSALSFCLGKHFDALGKTSFLCRLKFIVLFIFIELVIGNWYYEDCSSTLSLVKLDYIDIHWVNEVSMMRRKSSTRNRLGFRNYFNSIEKRASRASALRADGVPLTRGLVLTHPISSTLWTRPERSHS